MKIMLSILLLAYFSSVAYQWYKRRKNKKFRENLRIGHQCFIFHKYQKKEYKIQCRVKYINRDEYQAYVESGIKKAQGWYPIDQLFIA